MSHLCFEQRWARIFISFAILLPSLSFARRAENPNQSVFSGMTPESKAAIMDAMGSMGNLGAEGRSGLEGRDLSDIINSPPGSDDNSGGNDGTGNDGNGDSSDGGGNGDSSDGSGNGSNSDSSDSGSGGGGDNSNSDSANNGSGGDSSGSGGQNGGDNNGGSDQAQNGGGSDGDSGGSGNSGGDDEEGSDGDGGGGSGGGGSGSGGSGSGNGGGNSKYRMAEGQDKVPEKTIRPQKIRRLGHGKGGARPPRSASSAKPRGALRRPSEVARGSSPSFRPGEREKELEFLNAATIGGTGGAVLNGSGTVPQSVGSSAGPGASSQQVGTLAADVSDLFVPSKSTSSTSSRLEGPLARAFKELDEQQSSAEQDDFGAEYEVKAKFSKAIGTPKTTATASPIEVGEALSQRGSSLGDLGAVRWARALDVPMQIRGVKKQRLPGVFGRLGKQQDKALLENEHEQSAFASGIRLASSYGTGKALPLALLIIVGFGVMVMSRNRKKHLPERRQ